MTEKQNQRYIELKSKIKLKSENILLSECLASIKQYEVMNEQNSMNILNFFNKLPTHIDGRPDFSKANDVISINSVDFFNRFNGTTEWYIIWDSDTPIIKCQFSRIINNIDDITAVSFETWLFSNDYNELIEFNDLGKVTYAKFNFNNNI